MKKLKGKTVSPLGKVRGEALVTDSLVAFWGGTSWETGEIVEVNHPLKGKNIRDKILVFPFGKGGSGETFGFYYLCKNGNAPKAMICNEAQPTTVAGALLCDVPMIYGFEEDVLESVSDGDEIEVDSDDGLVKVFRK